MGDIAIDDIIVKGAPCLNEGIFLYCFGFLTLLQSMYLPIPIFITVHQFGSVLKIFLNIHYFRTYILKCFLQGFLEF